jgi:hypothetical protein
MSSSKFCDVTSIGSRTFEFLGPPTDFSFLWLTIQVAARYLDLINMKNGYKFNSISKTVIKISMAVTGKDNSTYGDWIF